MPQRRIYTDPTETFTFRMSRPSFRLLHWLAAVEGTLPSHYMRQVWEDHLRREGFTPEPGVDAVNDPLWGTSDGWIRDHTTSTDKPENT